MLVDTCALPPAEIDSKLIIFTPPNHIIELCRYSFTLPAKTKLPLSATYQVTDVSEKRVNVRLTLKWGMLANYRNLMKEATIRLPWKNYGRIINIISTSVKAPIPGLGVSKTIRAAVSNCAKTLSIELVAYGITVNNVLPGFTNTNRLKSLIDKKAKIQKKSKEEVASLMKSQVPAGRFGEAEEIANAVAFLSTPAASYINGINVPVDGGRTKSL